MLPQGLESGCPEHLRKECGGADVRVFNRIVGSRDGRNSDLQPYAAFPMLVSSSPLEHLCCACWSACWLSSSIASLLLRVDDVAVDTLLCYLTVRYAGEKMEGKGSLHWS